jgi:hypothetical protein
MVRVFDRSGHSHSLDVNAYPVRIDLNRVIYASKSRLATVHHRAPSDLYYAAAGPETT